MIMLSDFNGFVFEVAGGDDRDGSPYNHGKFVRVQEIIENAVRIVGNQG